MKLVDLNDLSPHFVVGFVALSVGFLGSVWPAPFPHELSPPAAAAPEKFASFAAHLCICYA